MNAANDTDADVASGVADDGGTAAKKAPLSHHILLSAAILACVLLMFYGLPLRLSLAGATDVVALIVFAVGLAGLVALIRRQIRSFGARPIQARGQVLGVLSVLYVVVVFFALAYYLIEDNRPGEFDGISTRTDALYYAIVTLGTVGYGDVHAVGQLARVTTIVQITFDLVVIGALTAVVSSQLARRVGLSLSSGSAATSPARARRLRRSERIADARARHGREAS